jgi:hypothetical protein
MRPALTRTIRATGALQFDDRRLATVTTKALGVKILHRRLQWPVCTW